MCRLTFSVVCRKVASLLAFQNPLTLAHSSTPLPTTAMTTLTTLTDPLVRKVVLHVYAQNLKADKGSGMARKKFTRTESQLAVGYGLLISSTHIKNKVVSTHDTCAIDIGSTPAIVSDAFFLLVLLLLLPLLCCLSAEGFGEGDR
jgi:hypothetical protein